MVRFLRLQKGKITGYFGLNDNFKFADAISMDNLLIRKNYAKLKINIGTYFI